MIGSSNARPVNAASTIIPLSSNSNLLLNAHFRSSAATIMSNRNGHPELETTSQFTASKRRKMSSQPKFYAVKVGHTPGIYLTWAECEQNITKFKNALFRTFLTRAEAEAFVGGQEPVASIATPIEKYYGVAVGRKPGVYTNWNSAQEQIVGWKFPKYRKFATRSEAEIFVRNGGDDTKPKTKPRATPPPKKAAPPSTEVDDEVEEGIATDDEFPMAEAEAPPSAKRLKRAIPKDGSISKIPETFVVAGDVAVRGLLNTSGSGRKDILTIHTDGSSLGNGKIGARAGIGVFFGENDSRNVAARLEGEMQTNQRAELTAVLRALEIAPSHQETHIHTDSRYSIDCVTVWFRNWERNDWQTSLKKPVLNRDLIQGILAKIREREALGSSTKFFWIKGHSNDPNNEAADRLAVRGAQME